MAFSLKSALQKAKETVGGWVNKDLNPWTKGTQSVATMFKDPLKYTPLSMRESAVPMARNVGLGDDIAYGLRGALSYTPYQRPSQQLKLTAPTTQRQKTAEKIGRSAMGHLLSAPIGGANYAANVGSRLVQGGLLGGGFQMAGNVMGGQPLAQDLTKGMGEGAMNSWQLAFTNLAADRLAMKFAPALTSRSVGSAFKLAKNPLMAGSRNKLLLSGIKRVFQRALLETPVEASFYSILDRMNPEKQETFMQTLTRNFSGSLVGNLAFAGLSSAISSGDVLTKPQRDQLKALAHRAFDKTVHQLKDESGFIDFDAYLKSGKKPTKPPKLEELEAEGTLKESRKKLRNLYNYQGELRSMGYSENQIRKISAREAKNIFDQNIAPFEHKTFDYPPLTERETKERIGEAALREVDRFESGNRWKDWIANVDRKLSPLKYAPEDVQNNVQAWKKQRYVTNLDADKLAQKYKNVPDESGWQLIQMMQDPSSNPGIKKQYRAEVDAIRADFDNLRQEAIDKGIDTGYLDNYIYQRWDNTSKEIAKAMNLNPSFAKERSIKTYKEGMEMGLSPLFTHPGQLLAEYKRTLDNAVANKELFDKLAKSKYLLPESKAPRDWVEIDAPYFPKSTTKTPVAGKIIERVEAYKAPRDIADPLNGIFSVQNDGSLLSHAGNVSAYLQNVRLAAGVPGTPINSFAVANYLKELTSGNVVNPTKTFLRSFSGSASEQYFKQNLDTVEAMRKQGIKIASGIEYRNAYKNVVKDEGLKDLLGEAWDKGWNEPTFRRLLPMLQIDNFKAAKKRGLSDAQAAKLVRNFYGLIDDLDTGRSAKVNDLLKTVAFAPRFREAMVNFWGKNFAAFTQGNIDDPSYSLNRRFMLGTATTMFIYNLLNKKTTGHWMWENKPGKEMELEIPQGGGRSMYIPVMSSIMTVPRRVLGIATAGLKGDLGEVGRQARTLTSGSLQLAGELLSNQTWYGRPITNPENSALDNIKAWSTYVLEQTLPYIGEGFAYATGRKSGVEAAIGSMELPIRFSASSINQRNIKQEVVDALLKGDQKKMTQLAPEAVKYSVESKDVILKAIAQATVDQDTKALTKLIPLAKKNGITKTQIQNEVVRVKYPTKERNKVVDDIAQLVVKANKKKLSDREKARLGELLKEAKAMNISEETLKKQIRMYK